MGKNLLRLSGVILGAFRGGFDQEEGFIQRMRTYVRLQSYMCFMATGVVKCSRSDGITELRGNGLNVIEHLFFITGNKSKSFNF
jgi:hypothetical protein